MKTKRQEKPVGVFDSGIGGLTVVKAIRDLLPQENIIYFGDIARLPYGTKSEATIKHFATQTAKFLVAQKVKAIVIACNTISAIAKAEVVQIAQDIPVIDVISNGVNAAILTTQNNHVGIIATPATVKSNAYAELLHQSNSQLQVFSQACSLFVPFIEEGFLAHQALELIALEYLTPLKQYDLDTLILGCTHYPLIKNVIQKIMGEKVNIVDPALETSKTLHQVLSKYNLLNKNTTPFIEYYVTEISPNFIKIANMFLKEKQVSPKLVNLDSAITLI